VSQPLAIGVERVSMTYRTPGVIIRALDDVSLEAEPGDSLAIVGPSGCGKSTLLAVIGALDVPTAGCVRVGKDEVSALGERERAALRRRAFGFVFQADNLLPFLTVAENVSYQLSLHGGAGSPERCEELLVRLGLAGELDKLPDQLSGGQRQRVAVARALIHRPGVILADEPTGALDARNSTQVIDLLLAVGGEMGATLVMVTHDREAADRMDRTVALHDGRLAPSAVIGHAR